MLGHAGKDFAYAVLILLHNTKLYPMEYALQNVTILYDKINIFTKVYFNFSLIYT